MNRPHEQVTERSLAKRQSQDARSRWAARALLERRGALTPGSWRHLQIINYFSGVPLNSPSADGHYSQIITFKRKNLRPATCSSHSKSDTHCPPAKPPAPPPGAASGSLAVRPRPGHTASPVVTCYLVSLAVCCLFHLVCSGFLSSWKREELGFRGLIHSNTTCLGISYY